MVAEPLSARIAIWWVVLFENIETRLTAE